MPGIDLHTHSTISDGTLTPTELVALGKRSGLRALALTDHDITDGLPEALAAGVEHDLEIIPGCELAVDSATGFMHILGLFLPPNPVQLNAKLEWLRERRASRNTRICDKLQSLGLDVTYERVLEIAGDGTVGRPHIAKAIIEAGGADSVQNAFDVYIGDSGRAYLPKDKLTPEEAIPLLKKEGATVILAHPYTLKLDGEPEARRIKDLKEMGLDGIEVIYTEHTRTMTEKYGKLVKDLDLLASGGSDFHGTVKPDISLGKGRGGLHVPYALLEAMKEARAKQGLPV
ncbi:PHP domain-containing protein [Desulfovibrio ferrophilus]|uniref:PHP domain protein n=1 Tax=Desulfovibrio ferrophilus TaxID=241368 RepID=A0A2Z6B009_9BACT|nr:PHP domain-containing protein [Desulfovibrio ferrophilus]BBD08808.1 PHP domain protein [Desulfovibrio ferrophilus]